MEEVLEILKVVDHEKVEDEEVPPSLVIGIGNLKNESLGDYWLYLVKTTAMLLFIKKKNGGSAMARQSSELDKAESPLSEFADFWIASRIAWDCLEAFLHRCKSRANFWAFYRVRSWIGVKYRLDLNRKASLHGTFFFNAVIPGKTSLWRDT